MFRIFILFIAITIAGCNSDNKPIIAKFIDSPVEGLDYFCKNGNKGKTKIEGTFILSSETECSFKINNLILGKYKITNANNIITPYHITKDPIKIANIAAILQSLDRDNNSSNGISLIKINETIPQKILDTSNGDMFYLEMKKLGLDDSKIILPKKALIHLNASVSTLDLTTNIDIINPDNYTNSPSLNINKLPIINTTEILNLEANKKFETKLDVTTQDKLPLTYSITNGFKWLSINQHGVISGIPPQSGELNIRVNVSNKFGTVSKTIKLNVKKEHNKDIPIININPLPVINTTKIEDLIKNEHFNHQLNITNKNGITLTYSIINDLNWVSIDQNGIISGTPPQVGYFNIGVKVSSKLGTISKKITLVVKSKDIPIITITPLPIINTTEILNLEANKKFETKLDVTTQDKLPLTYSITNGFKWLSINQHGVISGIPPQSGEFNIRVNVSNKFGTVSKIIKLNVKKEHNKDIPIININPLPVINTTKIEDLIKNEHFNHQLNITNKNGITLTYSIINDLNWVSIDQNGIISGTPPQVGDFNIGVKVSSKLGTISKKITLVVKSKDIPIITITPLPIINTTEILNLEANKKFETKLDVTTQDKLPLTYSITNGFKWLSINQHGVISGIPPQSGEFNIRVNVSNKFGTVSKIIKLNVKKEHNKDIPIININPLPVINTTKIEDLIKNEHFNHQLNITNKNGITLTYSIINDLNWVSIDQNGIISGTPPQVGDFNIGVKVSSKLGTISKKITLVVKSKDIPIITITPLPIINTTEILNLEANKKFETKLDVTTQDKLPLTYSITNGFKWLSINQHGVISGIPPQSGEFNIRVNVSNKFGTVSKIIKLRIADINNEEDHNNIKLDFSFNELALDKTKIVQKISNKELLENIEFKNKLEFLKDKGLNEHNLKIDIDKDLDNGEITIKLFLRRYNKDITYQLADNFSDELIKVFKINGFKKMSTADFLNERTFRINLKGLYDDKFLSAGTAWILSGTDSNQDNKIDTIIFGTNAHVLVQQLNLQKNSSEKINFGENIMFYQNTQRKVISRIKPISAEIIASYSSRNRLTSSSNLFLQPNNSTSVSRWGKPIYLDLAFILVKVKDEDTKIFDFIKERPQKFRIINDYDLENSISFYRSSLGEYIPENKPVNLQAKFKSQFFGYPFNDTCHGKYPGDSYNETNDIGIYYSSKDNLEALGIGDHYTGQNSDDLSRVDSWYTYDIDGSFYESMPDSCQVKLSGTSGSAVYDNNLNLIGIHYRGKSRSYQHHLFATNFTKKPIPIGTNMGFYPTILDFNLFNYDYFSYNPLQNKQTFNNLVTNYLSEKALLTSEVNINENSRQPSAGARYLNLK